MRYAYAPLVLISFALFASSCDKEEVRITNTDLYGKNWFDASQPDSLGFKTHTVTPVLGWFRDGFRFEVSGTFLRYTIAPTDGIVTTPATWTTVDGQKYHIKPDNTQLAEYDVFIDALKPSSLKAQIVP